MATETKKYMFETPNEMTELKTRIRYLSVMVMICSAIAATALGLAVMLIVQNGERDYKTEIWREELIKLIEDKNTLNMELSVEDSPKEPKVIDPYNESIDPYNKINQDQQIPKEHELTPKVVVPFPHENEIHDIHRSKSEEDIFFNIDDIPCDSEDCFEGSGSVNCPLISPPVCPRDTGICYIEQDGCPFAVCCSKSSNIYGH